MRPPTGVIENPGLADRIQRNTQFRLHGVGEPANESARDKADVLSKETEQ